MKWQKIDHCTKQPITNKSGWHIVDYTSGRFEIIQDDGKWHLQCNSKEVGVFKTLKSAKNRAEEIEMFAEWI